ncbi:MAG: hypothetical protein HY782_23715 [Chloroflexi bacterium]|nr:hypothetical protein [Chloroflexota bacterium]
MSEHDAESLHLENLDRWHHMYKKGLLNRREFIGVLASLAAAGALAACAPTPPTPAPSQPGPTQAAVPTAGAAKVVKDSISTAFEQDFPTLDPHMHSSRQLINFFYQTHDNLAARDLNNLKMGPHLATSWKAIEPTIWELELRQGVKYHNGDPFDAECVKYSFERITSPDQKSPQAANLAPFKAAEILGPYKIRIHTKDPWPIFAERMQNFQILSPAYMKAKGDQFASLNPMGTGPFKFSEWKRDQQIVLERNDNYWGPKPAFKQLVIRFIPDKATQIAEILAGRLDLTRAVPIDQIDTINKSGLAQTFTQKVLRVFLMNFDADGATSPNPFQDKRVRQAANYAVNIDNIIKTLQVGGDRTPANLSPLHFGFDPSIPNYEYSPEKAKALLKEAGLPDGFSVEMKSASEQLMPNVRLVEQAIQSELAKVGIKMSINVVNQAPFNDMASKRQLGPMWHGSWGSYSAFDADAHYYNTLHPDGSRTAWTNREFIDLVGKAHVSLDPDQRLKWYSQAQKIVHEECPGLFLWSLHGVWAVSKTVQWKPDPDEIERYFNAKPA